MVRQIVVAGYDPNTGHVRAADHVYVRSWRAGVWIEIDRAAVDEEGCGAVIAALREAPECLA